MSLAVPRELDDQLHEARGKAQITASRIDDKAIATAITTWRALAEISSVSTDDVPISREEHAFNEMIELMGSALRSSTGKIGRRHKGKAQATG